MFPSETIDDGIDSVFADAVLARKVALRDSAGSVPTANSRYVGCRKAVESMRFPNCLTTLGNHVGAIICVCSKEQVIDVHAERDVAGVANNQFFRDWTACTFVSVTVGTNPSFTVSELSVPIFANWADPQLTSVGIDRADPLGELFIDQSASTAAIAFAGAESPPTYFKTVDSREERLSTRFAGVGFCGTFRGSHVNLDNRLMWLEPRDVSASQRLVL